MTELATKQIKVLQMIAADMEADVKHFEGMPFNGKTLGELQGTLAATIQALAKIVEQVIERVDELNYDPMYDKREHEEKSNQ